MKKYVTNKNIKRSIIIITALTVAALMIPYAGAFGGFAGQVPGVVTGLGNSTAFTDVDNLFIYMLNESLPVGSIYMTMDIDTAGGMEAQFGGSWEVWGQGRVPVGADLSDLDFLPGMEGGSLPSAASTYSIDSLTLTQTGNVSITPGSLERINDGSALFVGDVEAGLLGTQDFISNNILLDSGHIPLHTHDYTIWQAHNNRGAGSGGSNHTIADPRSGTAVNLGASSGNWSITVRDNRLNKDGSSIGPLVHFNVEATFDLSRYAAPFANPGFTYVPPEVEYVAHTIDNENLTASGTGTVSFADDTVQPYMTVFMYKRTALAELN